MSKKQLGCARLKRLSNYFFTIPLAVIFFLGELPSQFRDRALLQDRQSDRIAEFFRAGYDFSVDGGKKSLQSGQWAKIVVGVKKGRLPVAGKKVVVSFSKPVLLKQDGEEVSLQNVERFTDELGRVTLNFLPKQVGNLEVLVFFLHPVQNYNEHLFRLDYQIYQKEKLFWSFIVPFIALAVLGFFVLCNLFFALFFPQLTKSFFKLTDEKKSLKGGFSFLYGFIYRFVERQPTQMLFPLLWCRPHYLLKRENHFLEDDQKKMDWKTERQFLLKKEVEKFFIFFFCAVLWVGFYLVTPSLALLVSLVSFAFLKKPWAFSFLLFCLINLLFVAFLDQPQPPVEEMGEMFREASSFIVVVFLLFPSPALAVSFFVLSVGRFYLNVQDYFFLPNDILSKSLSELDFVLMSPFWGMIVVSFFSTIIIYLYCRNEIKRKSLARQKASGSKRRTKRA